ncbi:MAG: hypothetical protein Q9186_003954 [Xanthomendoza sp. 1 TL-2023]
MIKAFHITRYIKNWSSQIPGLYHLKHLFSKNNPHEEGIKDFDDNIMVNYYVVLGVPEGATDQEIKDAYQINTSSHEEANGRTRDNELINKAYEILTKHRKKTNYDRRLHVSEQSYKAGADQSKA